MFYNMIANARDKWFGSPSCTVNNLIDYIAAKGFIRDAQLEAIKTYLYLKIACDNKPLCNLFAEGKFNSLNIEYLEVSQVTRNILKNNPAAMALYEYAHYSAPNIIKQIKQNPNSIDYEKVYEKIFYNVKYSDYLFSLPMGAGKTYLMAAFIYLDLYFALNEPDNKAFAHNFMIFAPSGLKSSVVPSLRTIQNFDPSWILPEPTSNEIKKLIKFEILDQQKTENKSNKTKNPNVQKIAAHQPYNELFGLVAVTNAEKVILDHIDNSNQMSIPENEDDRHELRRIVGYIPSLSIFIDEVHHAIDDEIKLRAVVNRWAIINNSFNSVIGFSGTPYLSSMEETQISATLKVKSGEISNIVYYYPLIKGIGNFLKKPRVKILENALSHEIIEKGVHTFLETYEDVIYDGGLVAKLGIYCGTISKLEEVVYPIVEKIVGEYGLSENSILKYHKGDSKKKYPEPKDSQMEFEILDTPQSKKRIVLLVQIGKEGWDCKSLTGIILSQEKDCPKNMVLQTSCRCLRQVKKNADETALIYLNKGNADLLNTQLQQQQHTTIEEFMHANNKFEILNRYDRREYLKLPPVDFYQLNILFKDEIIEEPKTSEEIENSPNNAEKHQAIETTQDFGQEILERDVLDDKQGNKQATFISWLSRIEKGSFGFIYMEQLKKHEIVLQEVFDKITYKKSDIYYYSSLYNHALIMANIRKAFYEKRISMTKEELIPNEAHLLNINNFTSTVETTDTKKYYPLQEMVEKIIQDDEGKLIIDDETQKAIDQLNKIGQYDLANNLKQQKTSHPHRDKTFHYLPYKIDSAFEIKFLEEVLSLKITKEQNLEVYYNGDRGLSDFKIKCYRGKKYLGFYTPDFLIVRRKENKIHKAIIVETKGEAFSNNFNDRREFMQNDFIKQNNEKFGYERFDFLYLEDDLPDDIRIAKIHNAIKDFFKEEQN